MAGDPLGSVDKIQALPFALEFNAPAIDGLQDKDGESIGLTRVQVNKNGLASSYLPANLDLRTDLGVLQVTTTGTSTAGSNYNNDNTLTNAVETQFDATSTGFTITTRLRGPLDYLDRASEQGGLFFGPDQDNYIKLVASVTTASNVASIEFTDEQYAGSGTTYVHSSASKTDVGPFAAINTLDLRLEGDASGGRVKAYYALNGGAYTKVAQEIVISDPVRRAAFFTAAGRAGLITAHKNDLGPVTVGYDRFEIQPGQVVTTQRPSVIRMRTAVGSSKTGVPRDTFVAADLVLPNGGVNDATLEGNVKLYRDGVVVPGNLGTTGGGDAVVFTPTVLLDANATYTFEITEGLQDSTGVAFQPFVGTFTTGSAVPAVDPALSFEKVALPNTAGIQFTSVKVGPDHRLYAGTVDGRVLRYPINADGTLGTPLTITSLQAANGGNRLLTGFTFDPASTASNVTLWVSHGQYAFGATEADYATDWTSKISKMSGPTLANVEDVVVGLPRSARDHLTNQPSFGPLEPDGNGGTRRFLYIPQGSSTSMGAPDAAWGDRVERLLSGAVLRLDTAKVPAGSPLNVKTADGGTYDPYAAGAPLTLYATGVRNAYDLVWTKDGRLYAPTNGAAAGGTTPAGPGTPGLPRVDTTQHDFLFRIDKGGYYGHPNPARGEYVMGGGYTPADGVGPNEVAEYGVATKGAPLAPDADYGGYAWDFGQNISPDGAIEYQNADAFGGALAGKLLVTRYSGPGDIAILTRGSNGSIVSQNVGVAGLKGFIDPIDVTEDTSNGYLYVVDYGQQPKNAAARKIYLLRPIPPGANLSLSRDQLVFSDLTTTTGASPNLSLRITNNGTVPLAFPAGGIRIFDDPSSAGDDSSLFKIVNAASLPDTIDVGESFDVIVNYTAGAVGLDSAILRIQSNDSDRGTVDVPLRGVGVPGTGGVNEPSLARILRAYGIPTVVGDGPNDSGEATTDYPSNPDPSSQELPMQRLVKAGAGPVTVEVLAAEAINTDPSVRFGYYKAGNRAADAKNELFTISAADAQSLQAVPHGTTSFDPGSAAFGLYSTYPGFQNSTKDGGLPREVFSEDALNLWDANAAGRHKVRFFPLRDKSGSVVPNAYIAAFEEFDTAFDSNDIVVVVRNVKPAAAGPEIGLENMDGTSFTDRLTFSKIQDFTNLPTKPDNKFHDTAVLRVRNTGSSSLALASLAVTGNFQLVNPPAPGASLAPGATLDLTVRFTATSRAAGDMQVGSLTINSNDADEPATVVQLAGFWQSVNEGNQEPTLQEVFNTFGYKTQAAYAGETLSHGGQIVRTGDEVISPYWLRADTSRAVSVRQITAFHTQGNVATLYWFNKGSTTNTTLYKSDGAWGQTFMPPKDAAGTQPAYGLFTPAGAFGWKIDGEYSDPAKNKKPVDQPQDQGHHIRLWVARDRTGAIIPDTYLMSMDYAGINYDYNDNTYLITNIKPESGPSAPTGLTALASSSGGVVLDWAANGEANVAGYNVYRSAAASGPWTRLNPAGTLVTDSGYSDLFAPAGSTWYYQVEAVNLSGGVSGRSNTAGSSVVVDTPPARPTGLKATPSTNGITLDWADNLETDKDGYNVFRSATGAAGSFVKLNSALLKSSSFVDLTAPTGVVSYYQVVCVDQTGHASDPAAVSATRPSSGVVPSTPTGLSASAVGATRIDVSWNAAAGASTYRLERKGPGDADFAPLASGLTGTTYVDTAGVTGGNTYAYRVRAENGTGASGYSDAASATTPVIVQVPAAPANLSATAVNAGRVDLTWSASAGAASYRIERKGPNQSVFTEIARGLTGTSFQDYGVTPDATYTYRVQAVNSAGPSPFSNTDSAATPPVVSTGSYAAADVGSPTPAGSTAVVTEGVAYDLTAGGTDVNGATDRFHFAYRQVTGDFDVRVRLQSLEKANVWTKAGLMAREDLTGGSRNVFVLATPDVNGYRISSRLSPGGSTLVTGTTGSVSYPNTWLRLKRVGESFYGYRSADGTTWSQIGNRTLSLPQTLYFGMAATSHNTTATAKAQFRDLGNTVPTAGQPGAPASLTATAISPGRIDLSWAASAGATGYRLERKGPGQADFSVLATGITGTGYQDYAVSAASTYAYRVQAVNAAGASGYSPTDSATTAPNPTPTLVGQDIGTPTPAGSTTEITPGRDYDVVAGGTDISGLVDRFHFAHRQITGNFDLKVRVQSLDQRDPFTKAGLMVREDLTAGARNAMLSTTFSDKGYRFSWRQTANDLTQAGGSGPVSFPNGWVRLQRVGDKISGYRSVDGVNWTLVQSATITGLAQTVYVGLAATSHNTALTTTAKFRDFGSV